MVRQLNKGLPSLTPFTGPCSGFFSHRLPLGSLPYNPAATRCYFKHGVKRGAGGRPALFSFLSGSRGLRIVPFIFQSSRNTATTESVSFSLDYALPPWVFRVFAPKTSKFEVKAAENDPIPSFWFPKILFFSSALDTGAALYRSSPLRFGLSR